MIVFAQKSAVADINAYSAAKVSRIEFDFDRQRIVIAVQYGSNGSGAFVPNPNIPVKLYVLDDARATAIFGAPIASQIIDFVEKRLLNLSLESGAQA